MKKEFIGYYDPTESEINEAWNKGSFAFDANSLLNLYRYSELTRKDFLASLQTIKDKLFLPYQAALEYHTNRIGVIEGIGQAYLKLYKIFEDNFEANLKSPINQFKKHPTIVIDNFNKIHSEFLKKVSSEIDNQKKTHPNFKSNDEILEQLSQLFENAIGKEFNKEELKAIYAEGKDRYAESIPPGYRDLENKKKKGDRHIYGDLIIWKELLNYCKKEKKPLIFVTDDRKDDWWSIENGKTIRPREELIKEFYDLTGIRILIYNADHFLQYAKEKKLVPDIKDETIEEVKDIRLYDETSLDVSEYLNFSNKIKNQSDIYSDLFGNLNNSDTYKISEISRLFSQSEGNFDLLNKYLYNSSLFDNNLMKYYLYKNSKFPYFESQLDSDITTTTSEIIKDNSKLIKSKLSDSAKNSVNKTSIKKKKDKPTDENK